ncbi:hypothetical protein L596_001819 [Steinernema carpocapsae]|uniref:SXP/RAL-2 family protein Ani s 5-like cation-binding domain-containing protein n=1 Tax=Steinernema carpocapsae TaxID=34508 RepID=A0A4U8UM86_STECR|nr:hypothetical protein L596_001819 [Steinernema carpocapsae]
MIKATVLFCVIVALATAHWRRAPVPIFLQNASDAAKDEYHKITLSAASDAEKKKQVSEFIAKQPEDIQEAHKKFVAVMKERRKAFEASLNAKLSDLSPEARAAVHELHQIRSNQTLIRSQKQQQIRKVLSGLSTEERKALRQLVAKVEIPTIKN